MVNVMRVAKRAHQRLKMARRAGITGVPVEFHKSTSRGRKTRKKVSDQYKSERARAKSTGRR